MRKTGKIMRIIGGHKHKLRPISLSEAVMGWIKGDRYLPPMLSQMGRSNKFITTI
jgi:hypothetical protein